MPSLDDSLKVVQIAFYVVVATTAVLTYRSAKRGWLNTVHTEYRKHVIERLKELSDELADEFDRESPRYWARGTLVGGAVLSIHEEFRANREVILKTREFEPDRAAEADEIWFADFLRRVRSDPFLPEPLREKAIDLFENRLQVLRSVRKLVLDEYIVSLANGEYIDTLDRNHGWLHNRVLQELYARGVGIGQIQEAIHELRLSIQDYFEAFDPVSPKHFRRRQSARKHTAS